MGAGEVIWLLNDDDAIAGNDDDDVDDDDNDDDEEADDDDDNGPAAPRPLLTLDDFFETWDDLTFLEKEQIADKAPEAGG